MIFINKKSVRSIISTSILATSCLASYNAVARIDSLPVSFETRSEAQLQLIQAVDFGPIMSLAAFSDCTMNPVVADWNGTPFTTTNAAATTVAASGSGCTSNAKSKLGHYVLVGDPGAVIKITLITTTGGTDFNFAPTGAYDVDTTATAALTAVGSDTPTSITLDANGKAGLYIGGTATIGPTALISGKAYTMNFDVDVTF